MSGEHKSVIPIQWNNEHDTPYSKPRSLIFDTICLQCVPHTFPDTITGNPWDLTEGSFNFAQRFRIVLQDDIN